MCPGGFAHRQFDQGLSNAKALFGELTHLLNVTNVG
jgi:hypothetical protein